MGDVLSLIEKAQSSICLLYTSSYSDNRNKIVLIDEKGQIVENLGYESELLYNLYENDDELNSLLSKANVSIGTYQKLKALIQINDCCLLYTSWFYDWRKL